ncbi:MULTISPECIES: hypothetical protein [unclassified Mesorhizobium]|nr:MULTISPECIES: hypothetical protein [unclassified Mesorhizobium]
MSKKYILDEDHQVVEVDLFTWARWYETQNNHVASTETELFRISRWRVLC